MTTPHELLTGLKQISSPNEAQTSFVSEKYVPIVVQVSSGEPNDSEKS